VESRARRARRSIANLSRTDERHGDRDEAVGTRGASHADARQVDVIAAPSRDPSTLSSA
jgi:hypothetical protein